VPHKTWGILKIIPQATPPAGDNSGVKKALLPSLSALIRQRLTLLGVAQLPPAAVAILEADVLKACTRGVLRTVTGPRIGRAMAAALAVPAATQGLKGSLDPLTSSFSGPQALKNVAGLTCDSTDNQGENSVAGVSNQATGGSV
jgi:hypothetical protein